MVNIEYGEQWPMPADYTSTVDRAIIEYQHGGIATPIDGDAIPRRKVEQAKRNEAIAAHPSNKH